MKKGLTPGILVGVIAVVATLVILLITVMPQLIEILYSSGEQSQCQFNLLLSKVAETTTLGFGKEMPVECKTTRKTITQNDLARYTALASQAIEKYSPNSLIVADYQNDQQGRDKWALANIIANDMKSCYDRGWRGKLEIGNLPTIKQLSTFEKNTDYLCILCTRYLFDDYTSNLPEFSIRPWLENNVMQSKTFYDYLTNDNSNTFAKANIARSEITPKKPMVLMYVADSAGQGAVLMAPYDQITTNLGTVLHAEGTVTTGVERIFGLPTRLLGLTEDTYFGLVDIKKDAELYSDLGVTFHTGDIAVSASSEYPMYKKTAKCSTILGD